MANDNSSNSNEIPLLTFNSLYSLLREEKKTKTLQDLPELFYKAIQKFLIDKKKEIIRLKNNNEIEKINKEKHILKSSKKIALEIIQLRFTKISNSAIQSEIFEDENLLNSNTLELEKEFFEKVKNATKIGKEVLN